MAIALYTEVKSVRQVNMIWTDITSNCWRALIIFCKQYLWLFTCAYLVNLVVYTYFFTTIIFTDHLFGNIWYAPFPSFRTTAIGRWFADFLNFIVGGVGVQSFQMSTAVGIQVANGILFAVFVDLRKPVFVFIATLFISLHPAFLDYYSFTRDHIGFTLGDTLALLGVLALDRISNRKISIALATTCFILVLATYQPKIAFIALLLIFLCVLGAVNLPGTKSRLQPSFTLRLFLSDYVFPASIAFVAAIFLYYISTKLVMIRPEKIHTQFNDPSSILFEVGLSYLQTLENLAPRVDYLPAVMAWLPLALVLFGIVIVVSQAWQRQALLGLVVVMLVALIPPALQLSFILNDQTPVAGRTLAPQAYCVLFFITSLWQIKRLQMLATIVSIIFVYYFAIVGSQETNLAAMKHIFDVNKLNRIVARVESLYTADSGRRVPVIVVGYLKPDNKPSMTRFANNLFRPRSRYELFNEFCQPEILNFFLGRQDWVLVRPTSAQVDAAIASQETRRPWPASDSVYLQNGTLVILLQRYAPGTMVTWSREKFKREWPEQQPFCG